MRALPIVEGQTLADRGAGLADRAIGSQINLFLFHRAPQALDKYIIPPGAAAVHADRDLLPVQDGDECHAGELATLIRVEDLRRLETRQRFPQSLDAQISLKRDRQPSADHPPAEPVHDGDQIDESPRHRDVGMSVVETWLARVTASLRSR